MNILEILRSGPLTTIQDLGRPGYSHYGVPPSGAMDPLALQIGNILVGNPRGSAGLEMTMGGIKARFLRPALIAVTGGTGSFSLNGQKLTCWSSVLIERGDVLDIGPITEGCRTYLTIAGGFNVPQVLGSKSTYLPAQFGGWQGRALKRGDFLPAHPLPVEGKIHTRKLADSQIPNYTDKCTVRVIDGPHRVFFLEEDLQSFYQNSYVVSPQSSRMGYRLQGPSLISKQPGSLISAAVATGTIQIPPDGQPIILAADRQTTGGYPVLGIIASMDFPKVAQSAVGKKIFFQKIGLEEAQILHRKQERLLHCLEFLVRESVK